MCRDTLPASAKLRGVPLLAGSTYQGNYIMPGAFCLKKKEQEVPMKRFPYVMAIGCIVFMCIAALQYAQRPLTGNYVVTLHVSDYTLQGPPTVTAAFIDQALYSLGVRYGIDPAYALAFFH